MAALPLNQITDDNLTTLMVSHVRAAQIDLRGNIDDVELSVIQHLAMHRVGNQTQGYRWADIKPRLTEVINQARALGTLDIQVPA